MCSVYVCVCVCAMVYTRAPVTKELMACIGSRGEETACNRKRQLCSQRDILTVRGAAGRDANVGPEHRSRGGRAGAAGPTLGTVVGLDTQ